MEAKSQFPQDFKPQATGTLKLGGLKKLNANFRHDLRMRVPIPTDHHTFEELEALRKEGEWKDVILSFVPLQGKGWPNPKVRAYSFLGKVIAVEKGEGETLVTLDKYGEVKVQDFDV